jgi:hypothetical protein
VFVKSGGSSGGQSEVFPNINLEIIGIGQYNNLVSIIKFRQNT